MWHDHATILKMGFLMVTVHVMYDPLVFLTDDEYQQCHPDACIHIQSEVEQPEVYLLSAGSSSTEDQAVLVGDRISCLLDLQTPVKTESGIEVKDVLRWVPSREGPTSAGHVAVKKPSLVIKPMP